MACRSYALFLGWMKPEILEKDLKWEIRAVLPNISENNV